VKFTVDLTVPAGSDPHAVADWVLDVLCSEPVAPYLSCDGVDPVTVAYETDEDTAPTGQPHDDDHTPETCGECQRNRANATITVHYWEPITPAEPEWINDPPMW
jgi:hypothetical protein